MNSELKRCFVSIELPDEIKKSSKEFQEDLMAKNILDARYTEERNLHLTLKFLGEIDDSSLKEVKMRLKKIKFAPFSVKLTGAGSFLQEGEIKIIWYALGGEDLLSLQKAVDYELKDLFSPEKRFMAHITVARVKEVKNKKELEDFLKSAKPDTKEYVVDKFCIMRSVPTDKGSSYNLIEEYPSRF